MKEIKNNKCQLKIDTNLIEIKDIDKNNLLIVIGHWLAVQQKEISKITKID